MLAESLCDPECLLGENGTKRSFIAIVYKDGMFCKMIVWQVVVVFVHSSISKQVCLVI